MSKLRNIQDSARHTVAAISAALGVDVAIMDADSALIASSKGYVEAKVKNSDETYEPHKPFIDAVMTEKTIVCKSPGHFIYCQGCRLEGQCPETAEVLCAIEMDDQVIGVISMVAFDEEQRYRLIGKIDPLLEFIHEMAQMLVSKIREKEHTEWFKQINSLIETTLDSINDGIITFDKAGKITHANKVASQLLKISNAKLLSCFIDQIVTGKNIADFIQSGHSIRHQEHIFAGKVPMHCLISIMPIYSDKVIAGGVLSLTDIRDIRMVVNEIVGMNGDTSFDSFIGESDEIIQIKQEAMKISQSDSTILIQGKAAPEKKFWREPSIPPVPEGKARLWPSTAPPFRKCCWKANCSAMNRALLPAQKRAENKENLNWLTAVHCFWMKSGICRFIFRVSC